MGDKKGARRLGSATFSPPSRERQLLHAVHRLTGRLGLGFQGPSVVCSHRMPLGRGQTQRKRQGIIGQAIGRPSGLFRKGSDPRVGL